MMWMMGYADGGDVNAVQDPFSGRRVRPHMPRPAAAIHGADFLALNHHLAMAEQSKRELVNTQQVVVSSRWNPTPEQLQTLEELYRRGTRTPSADQIQQITAQLRRYGKIEGKNVFYWFQNHKARERLKRRRQLHEQQQQHHQQIPPSQNANNTEKGSSRDVVEAEQTKSWASPTNSSTIAEIQATVRPTKAAGAEEEGWLDKNDDVQPLRNNAGWHHHNIINPCSSSAGPTPRPLDFITIFSGGGGRGQEQARTLELFPLSGGEGRAEVEEDGRGEEGMNGPRNGCSAAPYRFFEFLPLKN